MIIKKIIKQKSGKYKLLLGDNKEIITYDEVILNNRLLYNEPVNLKQIISETNYYDIYNKVINYIEQRLRSKLEITNYLNKFEINSNDKEKIITNLINKGLINDELFAEAYINDQFNLTSNGPLKIKKELLEHQLDETLINNKLSAISDEDIKTKIDKLVFKKIKMDQNHSPLMIKNKILHELINKGYPYDMINDIIERYPITNNAIDKDYDKIVKHLKGDITDLKIRQKLYQKGYSSSEINDIIAKKKVV